MTINNFIRTLSLFEDEMNRFGNNIGEFIRYDNDNDNDIITITNTRNTINFTDILSDIKQVIYNDPATVVIFNDGSKVCVKACANDKFDKETGLIYAIIKRLYANDVDENGYLKSTGLGEKLNKIVKGAIDQKAIKAKKSTKKEEKTENKVDTKKVDTKKKTLKKKTNK